MHGLRHTRFTMHPCLIVDEILRLLACELVASRARATAVALASCCRSFEDLVLDALWETQTQLTPLLKCFPQDVWKEEDGSFVSQLMSFIFCVRNHLIRKCFKRIPTKGEWTDFRKHARRMRKLALYTSGGSVTPDILFALQLRITGEPFLPRLKTFECEEATEAFIPFIPLFLSRKTLWIKIGFAEDSSTVMVASMIARLSTLCPDLESITLNDLPRDPAVTEAVSEMLIACNQDTLRWFCVDSPLTEEAQEVVFQLPKLSELWTVVQGRTLLPPVTLPNLTLIDLEYEDHLDWLQGFRVMALGKLEEVLFSSQSERTEDLLGAFESAVQTTSIPATLLTFRFTSSCSWRPEYRSLLPFTQLKDLMIEFSCDDDCSSRVDDDIITDLVQAMPKLELLKLGGPPCKTPRGVTAKGLIALACGCRHLSDLRIHFQTASLVQVATNPETQPPSEGKTAVRRQDCALRDLDVGEIPIPEGTELIVTMALLQIFPNLLNVTFAGEWWRGVAENITHFKRIGTFVHNASEVHPLPLYPFSDVPPVDTLTIGGPREVDRG